MKEGKKAKSARRSELCFCLEMKFEKSELLKLSEFELCFFAEHIMGLVSHKTLWQLRYLSTQ